MSVQFLEFLECQGCGEWFPIRSVHARKAKWCSDRCRKQQYAGKCVDCNGPTNGYNGRSNAGERCRACAIAYRQATAYWTPDRIIHAIEMAAEENGHPPTASEWLRDRPRWAPTVNTVQRVLGSWNAAIGAAGFTPCAPGLDCHERHTNHSRKIPIEFVPVEAMAFAVDVLGEGGAAAYFAAHYNCEVTL